jgi:hypothetical protein
MRAYALKEPNTRASVVAAGSATAAAHNVHIFTKALSCMFFRSNFNAFCHLCRCCVVQFTDEHGEVCPAGWTPGAATMKADPKGSLDYFAKLS